MNEPYTGLYDLNTWNYELPESQIAQIPANPRDSSRLLVWDVSADQTEHRVFGDILEYLNPGDLLVLNDTRVLPARLSGLRNGGGKAEVLLLEPEGSDFCRWKALVRPGRRLQPGANVRVGERTLAIEETLNDGVRLVRVGTDREDVLAFLARCGKMPLPPYIRPSKTAEESYQTVFALNDGSVAAPTAGLHFTAPLLASVQARGVRIARVTLHVGLGTFRPVKSRDIREHRIHGECCEVSAATQEAIEACRQRGGRVVAVGTTVVRALESAASGNGRVSSGARNTELFIYPGFCYSVVDALITNFHLPKSSLLMLVAAFAANLRGNEAHEIHQKTAVRDLLKIYASAVAEGYRFFSFGDAMFLHRESYR